MKTYVLVGESSRLPRKHLMEVYNGKRLIDLVIENLINIGMDVVVYSKIPLNVKATVVKDKTLWILPSVISLLQKEREFFLFGGDMPLISKKAVDMMILNYDGKNGIVPIWSLSGYLEPLHAIYTISMLPCLQNSKSLTQGIKNCKSVKYISAENMPSETFFNVNTLDDLEKLHHILLGETHL